MLKPVTWYVVALVWLLVPAGCIKERQSPSTAHGKPITGEKRGVQTPEREQPCVPPEISTGDLDATSRAPCDDNGPDITREPPDIHPKH